MNKGILYAIGAYTIWGFLPIYWKTLQAVSSPEILVHRMIWSFVFLVLVLWYRGHWQWLRTVARQRITLLSSLAAAAFLAVNWLTYIWAVNAGFIVETSLGYFINPLLSVLLGFIFLKERLRPWQVVAVVIALCGVIYLTAKYGSLPWIALTLAFTFGFYGLIRKTAPLTSLEGLSLEMALLFVPALGYLLYLEMNGAAAFGYAGPVANALLVLAGAVTAVPLLLFAAAARQVTLTTVGILQYIAPTLQFLIGVFVYGEQFTRDRMVGFSVIWIALLIYSIEGVLVGRRQRAVQLPGGGQPVGGDVLGQ